MTERTDPQWIARPSPFKVNGDQSTDGGSGHEALWSAVEQLPHQAASGDAAREDAFGGAPVISEGFGTTDTYRASSGSTDASGSPRRTQRGT